MTDGLTSFNLTQAVVTVEQVARIVTFEVGVSSGVLRTGARRLVVHDGADGVGSADG